MVRLYSSIAYSMTGLAPAHDSFHVPWRTHWRCRAFPRKKPWSFALVSRHFSTFYIWWKGKSRQPPPFPVDSMISPWFLKIPWKIPGLPADVPRKIRKQRRSGDSLAVHLHSDRTTRPVGAMVSQSSTCCGWGMKISLSDSANHKGSWWFMFFF